jgi:hypothetical protein
MPQSFDWGQENMHRQSPDELPPQDFPALSQTMLVAVLSINTFAAYQDTVAR